jgi:hypothetical protein
MTLSGKMTADRIGGLIWIILGAAIVYGSWTMDRLTQLQIHPATAPGLVPGLLGAGIVLLGLILVVRKREAATADFAPASDIVAEAAITDAPGDDSLAIPRVALSWALCLAYGGVLLGHGLPYWVLTAAFLFVHINLIDEDSAVPAPISKQRALTAALIAIGFSLAVAQVFEKIFLVRLP